MFFSRIRTLVIVTTDHGNANPGIIYGEKANENFDSIQRYKHTNDWILNGIGKQTTTASVKERVNYASGFEMTDDEATILQSYNNSTITDSKPGNTLTTSTLLKVLERIQKIQFSRMLDWSVSFC